MANSRFKFQAHSDFPIVYDHRQCYKRKQKKDSHFVGSIRKELITRIIAIECSGCPRNLMDQCKDDAPLTGYCGHLFCPKCADREFDNFKKNVTGNARPARLNPKYKFEVNFGDEGCLNKFLYKCKNCEDNNVKCGQEVKEHLRVFSDNIMLKNLYGALKERGFYCRQCDGGYHPKLNSLYCGKCHTESGQDDNRATCVWHADSHKGHTDLKIMKTAHPYLQEDVSKPNHRLDSLDRSKRQIFVPLYHCAFCTEYLKGLDVFENRDRFPFHLQCGHFIHVRCVSKVRENDMESRIFCIFCNEVLKINAGKKHFFFPSSHLNDPMQYSPCQPVKCSKCKYRNPVERRVSGRCDWCKVEFQLKAPEEYNKLCQDLFGLDV